MPSAASSSDAAEKSDKGEAATPVAMAEKLPEGFFDDPKMDAKACIRLL